MLFHLSSVLPLSFPAIQCAGTYEVNLETLETVRQVEYSDKLPGILTTAHPAVMTDGSIINLTNMVRNSGAPLVAWHIPAAKESGVILTHAQQLISTCSPAVDRAEHVDRQTSCTSLCRLITWKTSAFVLVAAWWPVSGVPTEAGRCCSREACINSDAPECTLLGTSHPICSCSYCRSWHCDLLLCRTTQHHDLTIFWLVRLTSVFSDMVCLPGLQIHDFPSTGAAKMRVRLVISSGVPKLE